MKQFKPGNTYSTRSICNHDCIFSFKIIRRTEKSIWTEVDDKIVRRSIEIYDDTETFYPFGKYSMAAIIRAN